MQDPGGRSPRLSKTADRTRPESPARIAVFGGKGGGAQATQTILNLARARHPYSFVGYLNDRAPIGSPLLGGNVLCPFDAWPDLDKDIFFVAPLHKVGYMQQNCSRIIELGIPASRWITLVDPQASIADDCSIGVGSYLVPFALVGMGSTVGAHCTIRAGANVGNDVTVEDFVFMGANSVLCSGTRIESRGAYRSRS